MSISNRLTFLRLPSLSDTSIGLLLGRWWQVFFDCLPNRVQHWLMQRQAPTLVVSLLGHDEALLLCQLGHDRTPITRLAAQADATLDTLVPKPRKGWRETIVELPAPNVLIRSVRLPVQVKNNLRQVAGYEINRLTPFDVQRVYYDVMGIDGQARGSSLLEARLAICPREQVTPWLERLHRFGSTPARLTWQGAWDGANLLPPEARPRRGNFGLLVNSVLMLVVLGLIAAVMFTPLWQKNRELEQLNHALRGVRIEAEQVPALREELELARAGSVAVLDRKATQPRMIDLLRELTDRLPDHTWVQTINFSNDEVDIRGESDQATELLNVLEQAPGITNVSFRSPVMQVSNTGKERFHIALRYRRPPA
ncbi:PilN domain-containing protein [Rhabdochromatium marinum]|uniref:PilN domain-containing protein n=1 Tax=Rhabdochromatium marinum TaxID=48729 RepID=UPI0019046108|nr:PilN domain-containing protein [Rhabdochromatium marinum]MBK1647374.1 hypothetical protein [Rhabdochromatium marinum]